MSIFDNFQRKKITCFKPKNRLRTKNFDQKQIKIKIITVVFPIKVEINVIIPDIEEGGLC